MLCSTETLKNLYRKKKLNGQIWNSEKLLQGSKTCLHSYWKPAVRGRSPEAPNVGGICLAGVGRLRLQLL